MARPRIKLNEDDIEKLAGLSCSVEEIASFFGCHKRTIERRFAAAIKRGRDQGNISLRRAQWQTAIAGNVTMQIWLGKQRLNQKDRVEHSEPPAKPAEELTDAELENIARGSSAGTAPKASSKK